MDKSKQAREGFFVLPRRPDFREKFMIAHAAVMLLGMFSVILGWPEDGDGAVKALAVLFLVWMVGVPLAWYLSGAVAPRGRPEAPLAAAL